jgi:hypothetical protein
VRVSPFHPEGESGYFSWALLQQVIPPVAILPLQSTCYCNIFKWNHQANGRPETQALVLRAKWGEMAYQ